MKFATKFSKNFQKSSHPLAASKTIILLSRALTPRKAKPQMIWKEKLRTRSPTSTRWVQIQTSAKVASLVKKFGKRLKWLVPNKVSNFKCKRQSSSVNYSSCS